MSKLKILPVEPLIQCEAGRAKTMQRQSLYSPRTPKWPPSDKGELSFLLKLNLQIHSTKMAPSFANLFLGHFEKNAIRNVPFQPHTWLKYIDDIFMIWIESPVKLNIFIDYLNSIHPTIKFTSSHSPTNVPFLDVNVSVTSYARVVSKTKTLQSKTEDRRPRKRRPTQKKRVIKVGSNVIFKELVPSRSKQSHYLTFNEANKNYHPK